MPTTPILAIDPGTTESGWVLYDRNAERPLVGFAWEPNAVLLKRIIIGDWPVPITTPTVAIEHFVSRGNRLGEDSLETVRWATRFEMAAWFTTGQVPHLVTRRTVQMWICESLADDAGIRRAITDRFGPERKVAFGSKKNPGPLFGLPKDCVQALAVAITYNECGKSIQTEFVPRVESNDG